MKIVRAWHWKKEDSVALSIYAAELVIGYYEKIYPNDDRPRKAIEAAKAWLVPFHTRTRCRIRRQYCATGASGRQGIIDGRPKHGRARPAVPHGVVLWHTSVIRRQGA